MIMKKNICLFSILLMATSAKAQLIVNDDQKVAMGTETEVFEPSLMVGNHSYFGASANASIGSRWDRHLGVTAGVIQVPL